MTSYVQNFPATGNPTTTAEIMSAVELRVISNLLQQEMANQHQDDLRILRNDQAFELGIVPPVIPGN